MPYAVKTDAIKHTCWDDPQWDGSMQVDCAGCDEAAKNPCRFCGYGRVFATHNDLAHAENGDTTVPDDPTNEWHDSPHLYSD
jgi:hypothetical protein